jgi:hypothetical protein
MHRQTSSDNPQASKIQRPGEDDASWQDAVMTVLFAEFPILL